MGERRDAETAILAAAGRGAVRPPIGEHLTCPPAPLELSVAAEPPKPFSCLKLRESLASAHSVSRFLVSATRGAVPYEVIVVQCLAFLSPGPTQMIILGLVVLLLFGNRLPSVMRSLGEGITEFKKGIKGDEATDPNTRIEDRRDHDR